MNSIDKQVRQLSRLEKALRGVKILVSSRKDGTIKVKWGKKLDLLTVPSKEWGNIIKDEFEAVISRKADMVKEVITQIDCRMQQLELDLFGKGKDDGGKGRIQQSGEQLQGSLEINYPGTECAEDAGTGIDRSLGEQPDAGGSETGD